MATEEYYRRRVKRASKTKEEWRWRVRAKNGEILGASSEGYTRRERAKHNLESLPSYAFPYLILKASSRAHIETGVRGGRGQLLCFYHDGRGWRWRITASNGRIVHASSEAFSSLAKATANLRKLVEAVSML